MVTQFLWQPRVTVLHYLEQSHQKKNWYIMVNFQYSNFSYSWQIQKNLAQVFQGYEVCSFGIGTLRLQKKCEKLFWECIFELLNLKRKINIEGQHAYCFSHIRDSITNRNWIELVTNDTLSSLYIWHMFDIWKTLCQETIWHLSLFNWFCENRGSADRIIRGLLL